MHAVCSLLLHPYLEDQSFAKRYSAHTTMMALSLASVTCVSPPRDEEMDVETKWHRFEAIFWRQALYLPPATAILQLCPPHCNCSPLCPPWRSLPTSQRTAAPRRGSLVVRATAQQQGSLSRREATLVAAAAALAVFAPRPAHAIFGLGDNKKAEEEYATFTVWQGEERIKCSATLNVGQGLPACTADAAVSAPATQTATAWRAPAHRQAKVITDVLEGSQLAKDAPGREERLYEIRDEMNAWVRAARASTVLAPCACPHPAGHRPRLPLQVAKYRRDAVFSGRPSYGNTYSAVNALAG